MRVDPGSTLGRVRQVLTLTLQGPGQGADELALTPDPQGRVRVDPGPARVRPGPWTVYLESFILPLHVIPLA